MEKEKIVKLITRRVAELRTEYSMTKDACKEVADYLKQLNNRLIEIEGAIKLSDSILNDLQELKYEKDNKTE